jgi:zinc D-Ala-D-Ala dipeptidase
MTGTARSSRNSVFAVFMMVLVSDVACDPVDAWGQSFSMPREFVYLRDVDPSIVQDIRYAGSDNFTGKPVPGYQAAECILLAPVAQALKLVQAELADRNLSLKVYDCYRPQHAVAAFVKWSNDGAASEITKRFYPRLIKSELFKARYISSKSSHSRGNAVDLTLVRLRAEPQPMFDPKQRYGACSEPAERRSPDNAIDMGTGFDCFDLRSHTANSEISVEQQQWRRTLLAVMERYKFKNYEREWWHFTFQMPSAAALKYHDFPILPRKSSSRAP